MLERIFLQILNMSFTASFVILAVMAARLLLKKAPRMISYTLWVVVLFRLVCPFSFESVVSLLPVNANPIPHEIIYQQTPQINTGINLIDHAVNASLPAPTIGASINPLQAWLAIGTFLWLVGIATLVIYSIVSLLLLKRKLRGDICEGGNVYLAKGLASPFVMGLFCPKIYLPASLTEYEKRYILLHEQTHIKRLDHVVKIVSFVALCLHWFNPLVWIAFFLCGKDMEMSCDEAVIKHLGSEVKKDYSSSLLALATGRRIVGGSPLAFGEGDTKSRIKNVLNYKKPEFWVVVVSIVVVVFVGIGLIANPKQKPTDFAGVNAIILEIEKENQSMMVKGIDQNSAIGDKCLVDLEGASLITVATNSEPKPLSLDDFAIGDAVVLFIGEVQESYPTRAKATTVQLQPKEIQSDEGASVSFEQAMNLVSTVYPPPLIVEADGDRTIIENEIAYTFNISAPMTQGDSATKEPQLIHIVGVEKSNGRLWEYGIDTGKWVKANPMTPDLFLSAISQSFQIKEGVARFIIPNQMPSGYDISQLAVHVSGTMPMGDDGSNMSLHAYEREDESRSWQLGKEYIEKMFDTDVPDGTEVYAVFSLSGMDGSASDHSTMVTKRFPLN